MSRRREGAVLIRRGGVGAALVAAGVLALVPVKVGDKLTFAVSIEDMKFFDEASALAIRG